LSVADVTSLLSSSPALSFLFISLRAQSPEFLYSLQLTRWL
jgi:hypothetical protein